MAVFSYPWNTHIDDCCRGGAVSIGNFDGVHLGHQAILRELQTAAKQIPGPSVAVTFDPHPLAILRPKQFQPVITTIARRAHLLQQHGADHVVVLQTSKDMLQLSAQEFFTKVLCERLDARVLIEGPNFGFGRRREGDINLLKEMAENAGRSVTVVSPKSVGGKRVSSSLVRGVLLGGDMRQATQLLGRPYQLEGRVVEGDKRGHSLGFPTANLQHIESLIPAQGVYAGRSTVDGRIWPSAINIGPNPTFGQDQQKIEVHLIGFDGDLYGKLLPVAFVERLRNTRPFASPQDLVRQLHDDVEKASRIAGEIAD